MPALCCATLCWGPACWPCSPRGLGAGGPGAGAGWLLDPGGLQQDRGEAELRDGLQNSILDDLVAVWTCPAYPSLLSRLTFSSYLSICGREWLRSRQ